MREQAQIEKLVRKWQAILRLQDWDIQVKVVPSYDVENRGNGHAAVNPDMSEAFLHIRRAGESDPSLPPLTCGIDRNDPELTVVHELFHVKTSPISLDHPALEAYTESMSRILLKLERGLK